MSDLPVGDNLQDHVISAVMFTLNDTVSSDLKRDLDPENILQYFADKRGSLTSTMSETIGFVKTKYANQSDDWPDIQYHAMPGQLIINKIQFSYLWIPRILGF